MRSLVLMGAAFLLATTAYPYPAGAQVAGYLEGHEVDFRDVIPPPPQESSLRDRAERQLVKTFQTVADSRWRMAELDDHSVYPRFAEAFGRPIDKQSAPALFALLERSWRDVDATADAAKDYFHRPRPFQRLQLRRVCERREPPKPEEHAMGGTSYPSGHSTHGWAVAMILARVAPERTAALMARAVEFEESRIVCGMHFPSDVEAGHEVAIAVVAHLDASPDFQADLGKARAEYASR